MIIDGKAIANQIQKEIKDEILAHHGRGPCLAVIMVGEHPPSQIYVTRKAQACAETGIKSIVMQFPSHISEAELKHEIDLLNQDDTIDGILVQLPLPPHIHPNLVTEWISHEKDVDGFHPFNVGKLLIGELDGFLSCTPLGIKVMMDRTGIDITGKHVMVIGRSNIVGKPMAAMLIQSMPGCNATVTVAHRQSVDIETLTKIADIIIVAVGQPKFITADMVKDGVVIIDVGINKIDAPDKPKGYEIVGDADFENLKDKCSYITPVPGGVGPMTIAMLLYNTWLSYKKRTKTLS